MSPLQRERVQLIRAKRAAQINRMKAAEEALRESRPVTGNAVSKKLASRFPEMGKVGGEAGRTLGYFGYVINFGDAIGDGRRGDWGGVASNVAMIGGSAMIQSGIGAPIGAALVAGSLIYEHRQEIGKAAAWAARKLGIRHANEPRDVVAD